MTKTLLCPLVIAASLASSVYAQAVTYDFTGVTTGTSWTGVTIGETVSGTFTFDVTQDLVSGVVGSTAGWENLVQGGSSLGLPVPTSVVFSMTAQVFNGSNLVVASYTSTSPSLGLYKADSLIGGQNSTQLFSASEEVWTTASAYTSSGMQIHDLAAPTYGPNGLPSPIDSNGTYAGDFWVVPNPFAAQYVNFNIVSLAPAVPEPSTFLLLLAGLVAAAPLVHSRWGSSRLRAGPL